MNPYVNQILFKSESLSTSPARNDSLRVLLQWRPAAPGALTVVCGFLVKHCHPCQLEFYLTIWELSSARHHLGKHRHNFQVVNFNDFYCVVEITNYFNYTRGTEYRIVWVSATSRKSPIVYIRKCLYLQFIFFKICKNKV